MLAVGVLVVWPLGVVVVGVVFVVDDVGVVFLVVGVEVEVEVGVLVVFLSSVVVEVVGVAEVC